MFQVGDYVVCGKYGVCEITKIGPLNMRGVSKKKNYYTLIPLYDTGGRTFIPVDNEKVIMRPVISKDEADALVEHITEIDALWIADEKKRDYSFKEALLKYDCREWIKIIKTIYQRKQIRIAQGKKVTVGDEHYLHIAEEQLYGELAVAFEMEKDKVEHFIVDRVKTTAQS